MRRPFSMPQCVVVMQVFMKSRMPSCWIDFCLAWSRQVVRAVVRSATRWAFLSARFWSWGVCAEVSAGAEAVLEFVTGVPGLAMEEPVLGVLVLLQGSDAGVVADEDDCADCAKAWLPRPITTAVMTGRMT